MVKFLKDKGMIVCLLVFIQVIVVLYSYNLVQEFQKKETTTYHLEENLDTEVVSPNSHVTFRLHTNYRNLLNTLVLVSMNQDSKGYIDFLIQNKEGDTLLSGSRNADELIASTGISIDMVEIGDSHDQTYILQIESHMDSEISFFVSADGVVDTKETYPNEWRDIVKKVIVVGNILLFICFIILLCRFKIEYKFLFLSLIIGFTAVFLIIPCSGPDEWRHFLRAYDLAQVSDSEHNVITVFDNTQKTVTCKIPVEYGDIKDIGVDKTNDWTDEMNHLISIPKYRALIEEKSLSGEKVEYPMLGTSNNTIIHYFPQVLFIGIAKLMGFKPIWVFYMARIGNMLFATLMAFCAIKLTPKYKNIMIGLYFIPGLTYLRSISSTDGLLFSAVLLLVAYTINIKCKKLNILTWKIFLGYIILGTYIAILKLPYVLLLAIISLVEVFEIKEPILNKKDKQNKKIWLIKIGYIMVVILMAIIFSNLLQSFLRISLIPGSSTINMIAIEYFITNPMEVLSLLVRTFIDTFAVRVASAISWPMDAGGSFWFLYILILGWICWYDEGLDLKAYEKKILLGLSFVIWSGIIFVFYMLSTIGGDTIWGVQGRYMLPIMVLVALCGTNARKKNIQLLNIYMPIMILSCNVLYYINIVLNFWVKSSIKA